MKTWIGRLFLLSLGVCTALTAVAQPGRQDIQRWLDRQQQEIQRGIDSGALTKHEARSLRRQQREIQEFGDRLRREGYPPHESRRLLQERLRDADRRIDDLTHNDEWVYGPDDRRPPPPPGRDDDRGPRPPRPYDDR
ncbi:hypothetical protein [Thiocystis violacea]|uniref:hypothetical protein n=1 Tax=Thiocystis violacea TaxID=13725 RepID=UPI001906590A|nr:hypothetical protein [Thiocystis violacea]MBK1721924.1 hypothetical protein [Thiocystis violacea]